MQISYEMVFNAHVYIRLIRVFLCVDWTRHSTHQSVWVLSMLFNSWFPPKFPFYVISIYLFWSTFVGSYQAVEFNILCQLCSPFAVFCGVIVSAVLWNLLALINRTAIDFGKGVLKISRYDSRSPGNSGPVHTKTIVNANASKRIFLSPSTRKRSSFT